MRFLSTSFAVLFITVVVAAQTPAPKAPPAPAPKAPPAPVSKAAPTNRPAHLAQVMRGVLFPGSNVIFDVQTLDPAVPLKKPAPGAATGSASETYADSYPGWMRVESAAVALDESVDLLLKPGRLCENGKPVPLQQADYRKFALELRDVARRARAIAQTKNQDKMSDIANDMADACQNCHTPYRDPGPTGSPLRCVPPKAAR